jgi:hypothetical protein
MNTGEVKDKIKIVSKQVELLAKGIASGHFKAAKFIG